MRKSHKSVLRESIKCAALDVEMCLAALRVGICGYSPAELAALQGRLEKMGSMAEALPRPAS